MDESTTLRQMEVDPDLQNAQSIQHELQWFEQVLDARFKLYFAQESPVKSIFELTPPDVSDDLSMFANFLNHYQLNFSERLILILSLCPHVKPQLLDLFFLENENTRRGFTEFGGLKGHAHGGFIPTAETAAFILAGDDLELRLQLYPIFDDQHVFHKHNIVRLNRLEQAREEPYFSAALQLSREYLSFFTTGQAYRPNYSAQFPAKKITTALHWDDLILPVHVREEIREIELWLKWSDRILGELNYHKHIKSGYRALFYGPPGTGKTLTASLIGKSLDLDVYRVDLSKVVSKWIGETEKNLASVFDQAEHKNWILVFDESEALFGKRSTGATSNDRHANQEIAYLLQRIEDFPGVVILCSNLKGNMDEAFIRRFQSIIYFPLPDAHTSQLLWSGIFEQKIPLESNVDLEAIARKYPLPGGAIINVLRHCVIRAADRDRPTIVLKDILEGVRKELRKEGKG